MGRGQRNNRTNFRGKDFQLNAIKIQSFFSLKIAHTRTLGIKEITTIRSGATTTPTGATLVGVVTVISAAVTISITITLMTTFRQVESIFL